MFNLNCIPVVPNGSGVKQAFDANIFQRYDGDLLPGAPCVFTQVVPSGKHTNSY